MTVTVRLLENPTGEEIRRTLDVLDEAFNKKYFLSALGDPSLPREILQVHIDTALIDKGGLVYVAETPEDGIVGSAIWFGPGHKFLATEAQKQAGWYQLMDKLQKPYRDWWDYFLAIYDEYTSDVFGPGVKLAGYHLQLFGVHPNHQRKGYGTAMIQLVEAKAKAVGVCTCLETAGTSAVPVYRSLGFEVKDPIPVKVAASEATFPFYGFIKY